MTLSLPKTMQAIGLKAFGAPDQMMMESAPLPALPIGWIMIKVAAAGVNRPDCLQRAGLYPAPADASPRLGLEVAGTIIAINGNADNATLKAWAIGDHVTALAPGGGYAEYCAVPASHALPIPKGFSMVEAAALCETYFTVYSNLFMRIGLKAKEHVLIHGGSSGIGTTAIQMAKAFGAHPIVTVGSEAKLDACLKLGAEAGFLYNTQDWVEAVKQYLQTLTTAKQGVDVVLDMVGAPYFEKNISCLGLDGRLLQIAVQKGNICQIDLRTIMMRRLTLTGSTLRPQSIQQKAEIAAALYKNIWPVLDNRSIAPIIHSVFPLHSVTEAHNLMESSQHIGKIILEI